VQATPWFLAFGWAMFGLGCSQLWAWKETPCGYCLTGILLCFYSSLALSPELKILLLKICSANAQSSGQAVTAGLQLQCGIDGCCRNKRTHTISISDCDACTHARPPTHQPSICTCTCTCTCICTCTHSKNSKGQSRQKKRCCSVWRVTSGGLKLPNSIMCM